MLKQLIWNVEFNNLDFLPASREASSISNTPAHGEFNYLLFMCGTCWQDLVSSANMIGNLLPPEITFYVPSDHYHETW